MSQTTTAPHEGLEAHGCLVIRFENFAAVTDPNWADPGIYQHPEFLGDIEGASMVVGRFSPLEEEDVSPLVGLIDTGPFNVVLTCSNGSPWVVETITRRLKTANTDVIALLGHLTVRVTNPSMSSLEQENLVPMRFGNRYRHSRNPATFGKLLPEAELAEPEFRGDPGFTFVEVDLFVPSIK